MAAREAGAQAAAWELSLLAADAEAEFIHTQIEAKRFDKNDWDLTSDEEQLHRELLDEMSDLSISPRHARANLGNTSRLRWNLGRCFGREGAREDGSSSSYWSSSDRVGRRRVVGSKFIDSRRRVAID